LALYFRAEKRDDPTTFHILLLGWSPLYPRVPFRCEGNVCLCRWEQKLYCVHNTPFTQHTTFPAKMGRIYTCPLPIIPLNFLSG
jgi:hypothetical protein